jgi:hypothetical protein
MKNLSKLIFYIFLIVGCSQREDIPLSERVDYFEISECKRDCGIDSIGIRKNEIKDNKLYARLGYIVNCSWEKGFLKNVTEKNDTLIIELDRAHSKEGKYPINSCDCFYYFDLVIKDYYKSPITIRITDLFDKGEFWDEKTPIEIIEIEDIEETEL